MEDHRLESKPHELAKQIESLHSKLIDVNQNLSEISSKFDKLNDNVSHRLGTFGKDLASYFDALQRDISSQIDKISSQKTEEGAKITDGTCNASPQSTDEHKIPMEANPSGQRTKEKSSKWSKAFNAYMPSKKPIMKRASKSEDSKEFLIEAIKSNASTYCSDEEVLDIVNVFDLKQYEADEVIVAQGSKITHYYLVNTGIVDVLKDGKHISTISSKETLIKTYFLGIASSYTFRARVKTDLWSMTVIEFLSISTYHRKMQLAVKAEFLKRVKVGGKQLGDIVDSSDIDALALASRSETYNAGEIIVKEGDIGDLFYIIKQGVVDVFKESCGLKSIKEMSTGDFFGEKALLSDDIRQATCIAATQVRCLVLGRDEFSRMLGNVQELVDVSKGRINLLDKLAPFKKPNPKIDLALSDLVIECDLGATKIFKIKLVTLKPEVMKKYSLNTSRYTLKYVSKQFVAEEIGDLLHCMFNAREAWRELESPFITKLLTTFDDHNFFYYIIGRHSEVDLYSVLNDEERFPEQDSKFCAACVVCAFEHIHSKKIAIRNVQLDNLIIGTDGYLQLAKIGFAKKVDKGKTFTMVGTRRCIAPEVIKHEGHDWAVDYWALGVLIYEMMFGSSPFSADLEMDSYKNVLAGKIDFPADITLELQDIIKSLCTVDQSKRMGRTKGGTRIIMEHLWYSGFSWKALMDKSMEVPNILKHEILGENSKSQSKHISKSSQDGNESKQKSNNRKFVIKRKEHSRGIFLDQAKELQRFQKKNFKHMIVQATSSKKSRKTSFDQFYLISSSLVDISSFSNECVNRNFSDPFLCKSIHALDRYPETASVLDSVLEPEEVASFCFPSGGVKLQLIPRCTLDKGGKRLIGEENDKYQLHTFTDCKGETQHCVSITIRDVLSCNEIDKLLDLRLRCKSAKVIQNFFHNCKVKKRKSNLMQDIGNMFDKITRRNGCDFEDRTNPEINAYALKQAKESYETMIENEKLGDVGVVEKCFIFIGVKPAEQSLLLCALQQLVQQERLVMTTNLENQFEDETNALNYLVDDSKNILEAVKLHRYSINTRKSNRSWMLFNIKNKLRLSPNELKVKYPSDEYEYMQRKIIMAEFNPLFEDFPKISLPLPLPDMSGEWGVATLFLRFHSPCLLVILNLLLLESPALVVGTRPEEVASCTSALLTLLQPFKWASPFIPLIPIDYLDLVSSPVPFIAGLVAENDSKLNYVLNDGRVKTALSDGLIVLNLNTGVTLTSDVTGKQKLMAFSQTFSINRRIADYQIRLKLLSEHKFSSLLDFKKFSQKGASRSEGLTIQSLKRDIRRHLETLLRFNFEDEEQWKNFSSFDEVAQGQTLDSSKLMNHYKYQHKFLLTMTQTQLFAEFLRNKTEPAMHDEKIIERARLFIADWLVFKWKKGNMQIHVNNK